MCIYNYSVNDTNVWIKLQNFIEDRINAFPIRGYVGNETPAMVDIVCEGFEGAGVIKADTTRHYQEIYLRRTSRRNGCVGNT